MRRRSFAIVIGIALLFAYGASAAAAAASDGVKTATIRVEGMT